MVQEMVYWLCSCFSVSPVIITLKAWEFTALSFIFRVYCQMSFLNVLLQSKVTP